MKKFSTLLLIFTLFLFGKTMAQFPTIYATRGSGAWTSTTLWETFTNSGNNTPGPANTGTAVTGFPSGTHYVYIRNGNSVTSFSAANRNIMGLTIEGGGSLAAGGTFTLKLNTGGGTLIAPFNYGIINNGTLGTAGDVITVEIPTTAATTTITGTGTFNLGRLRMVGSNTNSPTVNLDADINFNQTSNYGLTAIYSQGTGDNYTININAGKTVTLTGVSGYFNAASSLASNYTYNINGTLDLTANNQTLNNLTAISPTAGTVTVNVGSTGVIKTGAAFNCSPASPGVANLNIAAGGVVDATLATVFNFNGGAFTTPSTTSVLKRTVTGDGISSNFPVKTLGGNISTATISRLNTSGTSGVYSVNVQNTFDNAPSDPTKCVQKQWNISMVSGTPSADDTVRLSWVAADQGSNFNPAGAVTIMHYTAGAYEYKPATVSGSGTAADPYVAYATGFTSYSPFAVGNLGVVPLSLLSFTGANNNKATDLRWSTENETNVSGFDLEKSSDALHFTAIYNSPAHKGSVNNYAYTDNDPLKTTTYYRLKIIEANGQFKYSNLVTIRGQVGAGEVRVFPNPAKDLITAEHTAATENTMVYVFSGDGRLLRSIKAIKGTTSTNINVSSLAPGRYSVTVIAGSDKGSGNFIKQ